MAEQETETIETEEHTDPPETSETDSPDDPGDDIEKMRAALHKANEEAKKHRLKAKELEPLAEKAKELEDAQKTEQERLTEKLTASEKRAVEAELKAARLEVAAEKGLPQSSVKFLTGTTVEELAQSADELLELLTPEDDGKGRLPGKPTPRLRGGGNPTEDPAPEAAEIIKSIPPL